MTSDAPALLWFREDLRLSDNPALTAAIRSGAPLLCVFVLEGGGPRRACDWWLGRALESLDADLRGLGGRLHVFRGDPAALLPRIAARSGARSVFWNRRYDPPAVAHDAALMRALRASGLEVHSFAGNLLHEPWTVRSKSGEPFKLYGAYNRAAALAAPSEGAAPPLPPPQSASFRDGETGLAEAPSLREIMDRRGWTREFAAHHEPTERAAQERLADFVRHDLARYAQERDFPARDAGSNLSAPLRFGQITPRQIMEAAEKSAAAGAGKFLAELTWREFAWSSLWAWPEMASRNLRPGFDALAWREDAAGLAAWQEGRTGYPLVDAGMRQLWRTGTMPNRVRMVAASFLVKHLLIDWREGARWFAETLLDHDPANNAMNWQWCAGTGFDSAPFFRMMNPALQAEKFDPSGDYVRVWVPESGTAAYPEPIVDHAFARRRALAAYQAIRSASQTTI